MLHPLSHILIVIWLSSMALFSSSMAVLGILLMIALCASFILFRIEFKGLLQRLLRLVPMILGVLILQMLFRRTGVLIVDLWIIEIYSEGISYGIIFALRFLNIICGASLVSGLSFTDFQNAFGKLRFPEELSFMVFYVIRYVGILRHRFLNVKSTIAMRGIIYNRLSLRKRLWMYQVIAISVLAESLNQSKLQAIALELRGFRSAGKKTLLYQTPFRMPDMIVFYSLILLSLILIVKF